MQHALVFDTRSQPVCRDREDYAVKDLMFVGIVLVFFGIAWLYVRACEHL
jgi:hypothetical protein